MNFEEFSAKLKGSIAQLQQLQQRRLPIILGRMAKDHFQNNFRLGGFVDSSLSPWQPAKRLSTATLARDRAPTLLSSRNHLFSSIKYTPRSGAVTISNDLPYAAIHNDGGTINVPVTPKMRRYAWARFYEAGGGSKLQKPSDEAEAWRRLALTPKEHLAIGIPQRQFIGPSEQLNAAAIARIQDEINKILK
jgi:phage gpG-like protein